MKKVKSFNVGDKVFAKVKGYPAWPAKIAGVNGKKYDVTFYGTGERGSIKVEDLFYYLKHKEQYCKHLKRKDYNDAIKQIEAEIEECGTDGNGNDVEDNTSLDNDKKGKKRKRSLDVTDKFQIVDNGTGAKKITKRNNSDIYSQSLDNINAGNSEEASEALESIKTDDLSVKNSSAVTSRSGRIIKVKRFSDDEDDDGEKKVLKVKKNPFQDDEDDKNTVMKKSLIKQDEDDSNPNLKKLLPTEEIDQKLKTDDKDLKDEITTEKLVDENEKDVINVETSFIEENEEKDILDIDVVSVDYLNATIAYAEYVRSKLSLFQGKIFKKKFETPNNQVVVAKLPSGKLIGIKYNANNKYDTEYHRAMSEELEAKTVLSLKESLENGTSKPEDDISKFVMNIKLNEAEVQDKIKQKSLEHKKNKLKWLTIESNLVEFDAKIKSFLGLDKAEPKKALEYLQSMLELKVESLMLKKHPTIFDMVKRLRRYIGNVKEWNLTGEPLEIFESDAEKIRLKAGEVFAKFKDLFKVPANVSFWDAFSAEVEKFKNDTKDLKEREIFVLHTEPDSRQAFFDLYEERKAAEPTQTNITEKENSRDVANTEQSTDVLETTT